MQSVPESQSMWQHTNGNKYLVLAVANEQSTRLEEYPVMVVYQGENGNIWARKLSDWHRSMKKINESSTT